MGINPLSILRTVGGFILPPLGRLGKGKATLTGVAGVVVTSAILAPQFPFDVNEALRQVLEILRQVLAILSLLGFGRKTGDAAAKG